jgi:hypothetical protein
MPLVPTALLLPLLGLLAAAEPDKAKDDKTDPKKPKVETVTYDIADLIERPAWRTIRLADWRPDRSRTAAEDLTRLVLTSDAGLFKAAQDGSASVVLVNGVKLEVQATGEQHKVVVDVLETLRRLTELDVIVGSELYEVERDWFRKEIEPKLGKGTVRSFVLALESTKDFQKHATKVRTNKVIAPSGKDAVLFSLRQPVLYRARPGKKDTPDQYDAAFPGMSLDARLTVSADRRFVQLRLVQKTTELVEVTRQTVDLGDVKEVLLESAKVVEASATQTVSAGDGVCLLVQVHYQPKALADKGRVYVLLVWPTIHILEEAKERGKG